MKKKNIIQLYIQRIAVCSFFCFLTPFFTLGQQQTYTLKTVVIDAGHGGKDPGAVGKLAKEKDITLSLALKTGALIQKHMPGVTVIYTRTTDEFIELHKRADIANKNGADLFISIHVNANANTAAYGTDTWVMGLHKSKANLEVVKLENKVINIEENFETRYQGMSSSDTDAIIIHTMMQSANLELSATLAALVQTQFRERVGRKDRGVHSAPFLVLWKTTMPSILIETGFISNPEEEKFLMTELGQDYMASAIFRAFRDYKQLIERKTNFGVDTAYINKQEIVNKPQEQLLIAPEKIETPTPPITSVEQNNSVQSDEIYYSIQIASSQTELKTTPENFKGLQNVFILQENNHNKYLVGKENTYKKIRAQFDEVAVKYPTAFIVAVKNNTRINLQEAIKITQ